MKTEIATANAPNERAEAVAQAVALLRAGEVVALPTETVYGLAADALSAGAVVKIFETKERPHFDPLIVHLPQRDWLERVAVIEIGTRALIEKLIAAFWPGPLTIVVPRTEIIALDRDRRPNDRGRSDERASTIRGSGAGFWSAARRAECESFRPHQPHLRGGRGGRICPGAFR